jgi:hypothetical protein
MLFNRITGALLFCLFFKADINTKGYKSANYCENDKQWSTASSNVSSFTNHSDKADNKGRNIAQTNMHNI